MTLKTQDKRTIFFSNLKVSGDKLLNPHYRQTAQRILECSSKYILAIQDSMVLNYTSHLAKTDIGRIGKTNGVEQYGLIQHSTLCVTDQNKPLGLMDVQYFHYDNFKTDKHHHHRKIDDKATRCWVNALENLESRLGQHQKRIITVADREGDFYEFLHALTVRKKEFVIRAKHNRHTGEKHRSRGEKINDLLEKAPVLGRAEVSIQDLNSREFKNILLNIKAISVRVPPPNKSKAEQAGKKEFGSITVNIVQAYDNEGHLWNLSTNLPIDTAERLKEVIEIYRSRWHIEDYHKVLKTGYQVEEIQLHQSRHAIESLLSAIAISACRLYWLIYVGRTEIAVSADSLFKEFEWRALYVFFKEAMPESCPTVSEVVLMIARLGGYKPQKKGGSPPGIKTIWIGYQQFTIAAQMYRNMSTKT